MKVVWQGEVWFDSSLIYIGYIAEMYISVVCRS